MFGDVLKG